MSRVTTQDVPGEDQGLQIQQRLSEAETYNRWVFDSIEPYLGNRLLETGSAIGNMTRFFAPHREKLVSVDLNAKYVDIARQNMGSSFPNVEFVVCDVTSDKMEHLGSQSFDTVISLNLLEHIEDEVPALRNFHELLSPGGRLVTMVPAFSCIYGEMDKADHHFRRYTKREVENLLTVNGFDVQYSQYFNFFGFFAWFISGRILKHSVVRSANISLYEKFVPFFRIFDMISAALGQSVICVGQKK